MTPEQKQNFAIASAIKVIAGLPLSYEAIGDKWDGELNLLIITARRIRDRGESLRSADR